MYKSCKLANKSREGEEREDKLIKEEERWGGGGWGKPALKLPASFRLTTSCTFLLVPPRGSSSQQTIFLFLLNQGFHGILLFTKHLANGQVKLAGLPQGRRGGLRTALVRTAPQGCPEADRRDGVCRSFVVPASDRRNKSSHSEVGEYFTYLRAFARWNVPMFPAFLASKIATG